MKNAFMQVLHEDQFFSDKFRVWGIKSFLTKDFLCWQLVHALRKERFKYRESWKDDYRKTKPELFVNCYALVLRIVVSSKFYSVRYVRAEEKYDYL